MLLAIAIGLIAGAGGARLVTGGSVFGRADAPADVLADAPSGVWLIGGRATPAAQELIALLRDASADGLDPGRYRLSEIASALERSPADSEAAARAERLIAEAYIAYARDLRVPRVADAVTYVDKELAPTPPDARALLASGRPVQELRQLQYGNPLYRDLRRGLAWYRTRWGALPQVRVPPGEALSPESRGERVALLRQRLGLPPGDRFDPALAAAVRAFRLDHRLGEAPLADGATIETLNRGAGHFERLIVLNLDRVRGLPVDGRRHIVVDVAGARLSLMEGGREVDAMRAIVGAADMPTPEMAGLIRFAVFNPHWNIPPDLVRGTVAPAVLREGTGYLTRRRYVLTTDWRPSALPLDPLQVDWNAVATGDQKVWIRQLPGGDNMMGEVKFMLPNRLGIYLHDTPRKADFARADRRLSSGCVRVEDARRLARWIFGNDAPAGGLGVPDQRIDVPQPVPVYITYLTAVPAGGQVRFQADAYGRDGPLLERMSTIS